MATTSYDEDGDEEPWDQRINPSMSGSSTPVRPTAFLDDGGDEETQSRDPRQDMYGASQQQQPPVVSPDDDEEGDLPSLRNASQRMGPGMMTTPHNNRNDDSSDSDIYKEDDSESEEEGPQPAPPAHVGTAQDSDDEDEEMVPMSRNNNNKSTTMAPEPTMNKDQAFWNQLEPDEEDDENDPGARPHSEETHHTATSAAKVAAALNQQRGVAVPPGVAYDGDDDMEEEDEEEEADPYLQAKRVSDQMQLQEQQKAQALMLQRQQQQQQKQQQKSPPKSPKNRFRDEDEDEEDEDDDYSLSSANETLEDGSVAPMDEAAATTNAMMDANTFCGQTLTVLTDMCGLGGSTTTTEAAPRRSRPTSNSTRSQNKEAIVQAAKQRRQAAQDRRAAEADAASSVSGGSGGRAAEYLQRRHQSPTGSQRSGSYYRDDDDENTAIEVEFVEQQKRQKQMAASPPRRIDADGYYDYDDDEEDLHNRAISPLSVEELEAQAAAEEAATQKKNAVLGAMARKARADFEQQGRAQNQVRAAEEEAAQTQDLYANFTPSEKRKFLRLINEGTFDPSKAAQSILDERQVHASNKANPTKKGRSSKSTAAEPPVILAAAAPPDAEEAPQKSPQSGSTTGGRLAFWKKNKAKSSPSSAGAGDKDYAALAVAKSADSASPSRSSRFSRRRHRSRGRAVGAVVLVNGSDDDEDNNKKKKNPAVVSPLSASGIDYYDARDRQVASPVDAKTPSSADGKPKRRSDLLSQRPNRFFQALSQRQKLKDDDNEGRSKSAPPEREDYSDSYDDDDDEEDEAARISRQLQSGQLDESSSRSVSNLRGGGRSAERAVPVGSANPEEASVPTSPRSRQSHAEDDDGDDSSDDLTYPLPAEQGTQQVPPPQVVRSPMAEDGEDEEEDDDEPDDQHEDHLAEIAARKQHKEEEKQRILAEEEEAQRLQEEQMMIADEKKVEETSRKKTKHLIEVNTDDMEDDMDTYLNSTDIYSVIGATNPSVAGDAQSVYTNGSAMTGVSIHTARKRRPGAAKSRLAKEKETNSKKQQGWHKTIQAAASSTNRRWHSEKGWQDYQDPQTESMALEEQKEFERLHLDLNKVIPKKSSGRSGSQAQTSEKVAVPFPPSWEQDRQELASITSPPRQRSTIDDSTVEYEEDYEEDRTQQPPQRQQREEELDPEAAVAAAAVAGAALTSSAAESAPSKKLRRKKRPTAASPSRSRSVEQQKRPSGWVESMKLASGQVAAKDSEAQWDPERGWKHPALEETILTSDVADFSMPSSSSLELQPKPSPVGEDVPLMRGAPSNAGADDEEETTQMDSLPPPPPPAVPPSSSMGDQHPVSSKSSAVSAADEDADLGAAQDAVYADLDMELSKSIPDAADAVYADLGLENDNSRGKSGSGDDDDVMYVDLPRDKIQPRRTRRQSPKTESAANYPDVADFGADDAEVTGDSVYVDLERTSAPPPPPPAPSKELADQTEKPKLDFTEAVPNDSIYGDLDVNRTHETRSSFDESTKDDASSKMSKKKYIQIGDTGSVRSMYQSVAPTEKAVPRDMNAEKASKPKEVPETLSLERSESFPSVAGDRPDATVKIVTEKVGGEDLDLFPKSENKAKSRTLVKQEKSIRELDELVSMMPSTASGISYASSSILTSNRDARAAAAGAKSREGSDDEGPVDLDDAHDEWVATEENQNAWETKSGGAASTTSHLSKSVPKLRANKRDTSPISVRGGRRREGSPTTSVRDSRKESKSRNSSPVSTRSEIKEMTRDISPISARSVKSVRSLRNEGRQAPSSVQQASELDPVSLRRQGELKTNRDMERASSHGESSVPRYSGRSPTNSGAASPTSTRDIVKDLTNAESVLEHAESVLSRHGDEANSARRRSPISPRTSPNDTKGRKKSPISRVEQFGDVRRSPEDSYGARRSNVSANDRGVLAQKRSLLSASLTLSEDEDLDIPANKSVTDGRKPRLEEDFGVPDKAPMSPKDTRLRNHQLVEKVLDRSDKAKPGLLAPSGKDTAPLRDSKLTEKRVNNRYLQDEYKESKTEDDIERDSLFSFDENPGAPSLTAAEKEKYLALSGQKPSQRAPSQGEDMTLNKDRVLRMVEDQTPDDAEEDSVLEGSEAYGPAEGENRTFLQRLTECAAPVMNSSSKMGDLPSAHLAFLRSHPAASTPQQQSNTSAMFSTGGFCGRPDVIHEDDEEEKSEKSDQHKRQNSMEKSERKKSSEHQTGPASVVSDDFGQKTAYLEAIAMRAAVSKPTKKRRSKGDGSSSVVSTASGHSEKWKAFLERKKSGLSADMASSRNSNVTDVSKAAERYAAAKVKEFRSKSAPKSRPSADEPSTGAGSSGLFDSIRSVQSSSSSRYKNNAMPRTAPSTPSGDADDLAAARYQAMMSVMGSQDEI